MIDNVAINLMQVVDSNAADKAGGAGISISLGSSSSQSQQNSSTDNARGSSVNAGGNITIQATGSGKDSDITIQGSNVTAGKATTLKADDQVNLLAAQNTTNESSSNQSKSGSIGVAISTQGTGVTASASRATGQGAGNSTTFTNTQVAGSTVNIESGGDTTLQGAVVQGNQVTATVGGNLNIQSLQDTSQYKESSKTAGGSVTVGVTNSGPVSGNVNLGRTSINSTFTSVNEQSAIRAGDGGFDVSVKGKTDLVGGQITSTQAAVDADKNTFSSAGGVTTTDLQNSASFEAKSVSVGVGTGALPGKSVSAGMSGAGFGSDKGSASSTTTAGISGVAGDQQARTGDQETGLTAIFDKDKAKAEVAAQVAITSEFGKHASKAVGDYAGNQRKDLSSKANAETDPDKKAAFMAEAAKWEEGGAYRVAMHTVVGGLTGGAAGAVGAGAASAAAPTIEQLQSQLQEGLKSAGLGDSAANLIASLASGATAAGIGAAASGGSVAGGATAFNADVNNRQLHPDERKKAKELAAKAKAMGLTKPDGSVYTQEDIEDEMRRGSNTAKGETAASNMIINPEADKALGSNSKDAMASTNFDKGAVFNNVGGSVVQVERDGSPLASKPGDPDLQAYIQANTGGADSPYVWVNTQPDKANPNAGLRTMTPALNGCATVECAGGVVGVRNPVRDGTDVRNDVADGAALVSRGSGIVGSTATAVSTIPGPHQPGAATTAVVATGVGFVADVVEQGARPNVGKGVHDFFLNTAQNQIDNKLPLAAPFSNEVKTFWTNSGTAKSFEVWVNERWSEAVKQLEKSK